MPGRGILSPELLCISKVKSNTPVPNPPFLRTIRQQLALKLFESVKGENGMFFGSLGFLQCEKMREKKIHLKGNG